MNKLPYQAHMYLVNFPFMLQKGHKYHCFSNGFYFTHKKQTSHILLYFQTDVSNHGCYSTSNNLHSNWTGIQWYEFASASCNYLEWLYPWKQPFSTLVYSKTEPLSFFYQVPMHIHSALVFPDLFFRLSPNYCLTSQPQAPTNHLKYFYNHSNQTGNQTWKKLPSFTRRFFLKEI